MVRLEEHKKTSETQLIEKLPFSERVYIPLVQHIGKPCLSKVNPADHVCTGEQIASAEATVFSPIHASLSGKVIAVKDWPHPVLGRGKVIVIENDTQDTLVPEAFSARLKEEEINRLTPEEIRRIIFSAGIVGLGGAGFPTHLKLKPPKAVDSFILNAAECEPYLTADYRLMVEKTKEILLGVELITRCLGVQKVYVAIEENKPEAIKQFKLQGQGLMVKILPSRYPQGGERQLIKKLLGKEVPQGKLPFDIGVVVHNVATAFAIYEAVYQNKPLYERVVTVTGSCVAHPKNLLVRIGTPIKDLISFCGPLEEEPAKIILGGPMMGLTQYSEEVPVIKTTTGIILLSKKEVLIPEEESCIRCGACVRECPAGLMPCLINLAAEKEMWLEAEAYRPLDCIECGLCSYVCPANRRLVQSIKRAKLEVVR